MAFTTRRSLLEKVRAGDEISWQEFYETYRPLIRVCGKDYSLRDDEIDELVQLVMCEVFRKDILAKYDLDHVPGDIVFKYDPAKGRFRHFFKGIVRNQALKLLRKRAVTLDDGQIPDLPADDDALDRSWDREWGQFVMKMGLQELRGKVRAETYMAFEMYAIQERNVQEVAEMLDISVASVYTAKSRCIAALREIIGRLKGV